MQFVIGGIVGFLVGAAVLFFMQKSKIDRKEKQLQQMQKKLEQSEQEHQTRLQNTIMSLQEESELKALEATDKAKLETQALIKKLEKENINKIESLERANLTDIEELEKSHQATIQELQDSHRAKIQELEESHKKQLEETVNSVKEEYENQLKQFDISREELKNKTENFDEFLEGLPSIDSLDFDEAELSGILTGSDEPSSLSDATEAGIKELFKIGSEDANLNEADPITDDTDEIQQLADFFEDLPSYDEESLDLEGLTNSTDNKSDSVLDELNLEQKPLEEEIKRLSDLLDAFPTISEEENGNTNNNNNNNK